LEIGAVQQKEVCCSRLCKK